MNGARGGEIDAKCPAPDSHAPTYFCRNPLTGQGLRHPVDCWTGFPSTITQSSSPTVQRSPQVLRVPAVTAESGGLGAVRGRKGIARRAVPGGGKGGARAAGRGVDTCRNVIYDGQVQRVGGANFMPAETSKNPVQGAGTGRRDPTLRGKIFTLVQMVLYRRRRSAAGDLGPHGARELRALTWALEKLGYPPTRYEEVWAEYAPEAVREKRERKERGTQARAKEKDAPVPVPVPVPVPEPHEEETVTP